MYVQVSKLKQGLSKKSNETSKKVEFILADNKEQTSVKLWKEKVFLDVRVGQTVTVTNVITNIFDDKKYLSSSYFTSVNACYVFAFLAQLASQGYWDMAP